ncbi:MAG: phage portal protein [Candidatus Methylomirabilales bacterium]
MPYRHRTTVRALATYEGASTTRRARGIHAPTVGPNSGLVYSLGLLRDRSRAAVRNDGHAEAGIDSLVSNIVGTGITPKSLAPDPEFRKRLHQLWWDWTSEADADGLLDFYGQQSLAVRGWLEGGEEFIRLRPRLPGDGLTVPLQVQLLEAELVPQDYTTTAPNGNPIRAGIEFDKIGRRAAYWCWQQRPEQLDPFQAGAAMVRIPADQMVHLYAPIRAGQIRGLPQLTRAIIRLHDIDNTDDAVRVRHKLANLFVGFIRPPAVDSSPEVDPLTGKAIETENDRALVGLEPGLFQELAPGEDVTFSQPPQVGGDYSEFLRLQLRGAAVAVGVPYELLTGDLGQVSDRSLRVIIQEFRRRIEQRQHHVVAHMLNRRIWLAFITRAILAGALDAPAAYWADPRPWTRVEWTPPAWPYLHPVQDVEHEKLMVRSGFKSRQQVVKERGWDVETVDAEIAADRARADSLGLQFDSDGGRPSGGTVSNQEPEPAAPARAKGA